MKISVICKSREWQVEELRRAAGEAGIAFEVRDLDSVAVPHDLGEVVIWRSSSLAPSDRQIAMRSIMQDRFLINRCLALHPRATSKAFQQMRIQEEAKSVPHIETFVFETRGDLREALTSGRLRLPFIQKPDRGSKGENIFLIRNEAEIASAPDPSGFVFQNFVENEGDYRVLMLGGKMLGAVRRRAAEGAFLNNVSQGGSVEAVNDPSILKRLQHIASTVASVFDLSLCGVDIMYDQKSKTYRFLEVNTVPQWKGFQQATGIDVAGAVIRHCQELNRRRMVPAFESILANYRDNLALLHNKRFHFLSRAALWTRDPFYLQEIGKLETWYLGNSEGELRMKLAEMLDTPSQPGEKALAKERRAPLYEKYPLLQPYLDLLFRSLFAETLFSRDIRPFIRELVPDEAFRALSAKLSADGEALQVLSTHAVNYLYLARLYFAEPREDLAAHLTEALSIPEEGSPEDLELSLYFATHCVIGASAFYGRNVPESERPLYHDMLSRADAVISKRPSDVSLDIKCEFLVCSRIIGYRPVSGSAILDEAERSLSPDGNFLIDRYNWKCASDARNSFEGGEHRNVLFLMAHLDSPLYPFPTPPHA